MRSRRPRKTKPWPGSSRTTSPRVVPPAPVPLEEGARIEFGAIPVSSKDRAAGDEEQALVRRISSAANVVAGVDYASANAYLDAFANEHAKDRATRTLAVDFDSWRDVGIALQAEVPAAMRERHAASLANGIAPDEGCDALWRALASPLTQLYVSPMDLALRDDFDAPARDTSEDGATKDKATTPARLGQARPSLSTEYSAPTSETEKSIAGIWGDLLGIEGVGTRDNFFELGGNSLLMMQLSVRLRAQFGVVLADQVELFDTPDVAAPGGAHRLRCWSMSEPPARQDETSESGETEEFTL